MLSHKVRPILQMMRIHFAKYQGTGNDFIMIDGREEMINFSVDQIQEICDRRFGVGADGLIILKNIRSHDFEMDYYNADGSQSFCGNGSRCAQAFAKELGMINESSFFYAIDGSHQGKSIGMDFGTKMGKVTDFEKIDEDYFIHTGSPHYIRYVDDVTAVDVFKEGRKIRNTDKYREEGTNVNFVSIEDSILHVRTYERGVEDETYSCGTGVTAVAISYLIQQGSFQKEVHILTKGGKLKIELDRLSENEFDDIWLIGPGEKVFEGWINH